MASFFPICSSRTGTSSVCSTPILIWPAIMAAPTFELRLTSFTWSTFSPQGRRKAASATARAPPTESTPTAWSLSPSHFSPGSIEASSQSGFAMP